MLKKYLGTFLNLYLIKKYKRLINDASLRAAHHYNFHLRQCQVKQKSKIIGTLTSYTLNSIKAICKKKVFKSFIL